MKFITTEKVSETPKQINTYLNDLRGKMQGLLNYNYLLESFNIR
jgi:hypothetical protein